MKTNKFQTGGPAYLEYLRKINPNFAKSVSSLRNQFTGANLATFDKRGNRQLGAFKNMPKAQQDAYLKSQMKTFSSPTKDTVENVRASLDKKFTPTYQFAVETPKENVVSEDIYKRLGMAQSGGLTEGLKKVKAKGLNKGGGIAIKGTTFTGVK